jgi:hypothetical protein
MARKTPHPVFEEVMFFLKESRGRERWVFVPTAEEGIVAALLVTSAQGELDQASADCLQLADYFESQGARTAALTLRTAVQTAQDTGRTRKVGRGLRRREVVEKTAERFSEFSEVEAEVAHTAAHVEAKRPQGSLRKADLRGALLRGLRG